MEFYIQYFNWFRGALDLHRLPILTTGSGISWAGKGAQAWTNEDIGERAWDNNLISLYNVCKYVIFRVIIKLHVYTSIKPNPNMLNGF